MTVTLLLGGARSGKSALAVEMGRRHPGHVTYVATAPARHDADMSERVERHRAERPMSWTTIEEHVDLVGALDAAGSGLVIVDCLTLWTSNVMAAGCDDDEIHQRAICAAEAATGRADPVVVVSNEVGLGVHPSSELGRRYRDVHGRVNQVWADRVGRVGTCLLMVAGRAIRLDEPWAHI